MEEWEAAGYFSPAPISNDALRSEDVPSDTAAWHALQRFALTFNGYEYCGSFEKCAEVAAARDFADIGALRTALFFEQRRWRHFGEHPDDAALADIRRIVSGIRALLAS